MHPPGKRKKIKKITKKQKSYKLTRNKLKRDIESDLEFSVTDRKQQPINNIKQITSKVDASILSHNCRSANLNVNLILFL